MPIAEMIDDDLLGGNVPNDYSEYAQAQQGQGIASSAMPISLPVHLSVLRLPRSPLSPKKPHKSTTPPKRQCPSG